MILLSPVQCRHQELVDFEFSVQSANVSTSSAAWTCWDAVQFRPGMRTPLPHPFPPPSPSPSLPHPAWGRPIDYEGPAKRNSSLKLARAGLNDATIAGHWRSWLLHMAAASDKFAASRDGGSPCRAVFGRGGTLSPFEVSACDNKIGACYLWCMCAGGGRQVNSSTPCPRDSSPLRTVPLVPDAFHCPTKAAIRKALGTHAAVVNTYNVSSAISHLQSYHLLGDRSPRIADRVCSLVLLVAAFAAVACTTFWVSRFRRTHGHLCQAGGYLFASSEV